VKNLSENKRIEQLEDMVLELLLANKQILLTLLRDKIMMTMESHTVISAQDRRATEVREKFSKYIQQYNLDTQRIKKKFEEIEKL